MRTKRVNEGLAGKRETIIRMMEDFFINTAEDNTDFLVGVLFTMDAGYALSVLQNKEYPPTLDHEIAIICEEYVENCSDQDLNKLYNALRGVMG